MRKTVLLLIVLFVSFSGLYAQPFSKVIVDTTTLMDANDSNYVYAVADFNGDRVADLYCIKESNTGSLKTEVHVLSGAAYFQKFIVQEATPIPLEPGNYTYALADYNNDRVPDLYAIKKRNTPGNKLEVHILDGANRYRSFLLQTSTPLDVNEADYIYSVGTYDPNRTDRVPDVYAVMKSHSASLQTEVHVLNGAVRYSAFNLQTPTLLSLKNKDNDFIVADYDWDAISDVYVVQKDNTASGFLELHLMNGSYAYQRYKLETATPLPVKAENTLYLAGDYDRDDACDFFAIRQGNTASGKVEVKILCGRCKKPKK
ncbi:MAG: hypothetical protein HYZ15_02165 [Sphingobacteriales bacterium]|nr:hypothetical protein [Sphingobacteriales bacterium]